MNVTLTIHGIAKTAGSKRVFHVRRKDGSLVFGKGGIPITNVTDDCKGSKQWRKIVQYQARDQWPHGLAPFDCALEVVFRFFVVRPKAHYRTGKFASTLRDDAPPFPSVKPDVLKLARALEDALTGIAWVDDALICGEYIEKRWSDETRTPFVTVDIGPREVKPRPWQLNFWGDATEASVRDALAKGGE